VIAGPNTIATTVGNTLNGQPTLADPAAFPVVPVTQVFDIDNLI
jgi:hypothetical protein